MNAFISWLESNFAPKMNKIVQNNWIQTIKNSVMQVLPLIFLGSLFCVLTVPADYIEAWPNFWTPYYWTFGLVSIFVAFLIPYNLLNYKDHKRSAINGGIAGTILFLMSLNPQFVADQAASLEAGEQSVASIAMVSGLGAGGMFLAIICGVISAAVLNLFANFTFFKPTSVIPDFVKDWFNSMLPIGILVICGWVLTDANLLNINLYQVVVNLFMPLQNIINTPYGFVIISFMYVFLYSMGISTWVLAPVTTPILLANAESNMALVAAGNATNATLSLATDATFYSTYMWVGGIGCTMTLVFMMAFMAKSGQLKALGRACIAPAVFNINEPVVFGAIAWNPIMMVPMWLQGIMVPLVTWLFTKVIPFAPIPSMLFNMWYCPFPVCTWLTTGSVTALILLALVVVLSWFIWMPFFRVYDKQLVEQETAEAEDDDEDDWSF